VADPRRNIAVAAIVAALIGAAVGFAVGGSTTGAPRVADPTATGTALVEEFMGILKARDREAFLAFSSPAFQIVRADGTGLSRDAYADDLPYLSEVTVDRVTVEQAGAVMTARYFATVTGSTGEGKPYSPGPAPRLTVFAWDGSAWRIAAHGNFNALAGGGAIEGGSEYVLDFDLTGPPEDQHFHDVTGNGALRYGSGRLVGAADLGGTPVDVEILAWVAYVDGAGPFTSFLTFRAPSGDELALRYVGEATPGTGGTTQVDGTLTVIGGSGAYEGVTGGGTLSGTRTGAVGSPVDYDGTLSLVGMP
jgi:hypothetical protein